MTGRGEECLTLELGAYDLVRAMCLHNSGRVADARAFATAVDAQLTSNGMGDTDHLDDVGAQDLASYYALVGDVPNAVRWLTRAFEISPTGIETKILYSDVFAPVRDHADFEAAAAEVRAGALVRIRDSRARLGGPG